MISCGEISYYKSFALNTLPLDFFAIHRYSRVQ